MRVSAWTEYHPYLLFESAGDGESGGRVCCLCRRVAEGGRRERTRGGPGGGRVASTATTERRELMHRSQTRRSEPDWVTAARNFPARFRLTGKQLLAYHRL